MTDIAKSTSKEEIEKLETKPKREADVEDPDVTTKKFKTEAAADSGDCTGRKLEAGNGDEEDKIVKREVELEIEADAAEDKGSRHTMEDAWVLLLDASLDSPGKLRFIVVLSSLSRLYFTCALVEFILYDSRALS